MNDRGLPAVAQAAMRYWWLFLIQGLVGLVIGALLTFKPDRSLAFVAVLLGIYVIFWGLVQLASIFVISESRAAHALVGIAAIAVGGVVIAAPDRTVDLVVALVGVYAIVWGLFAALALFGERPDKWVRVLQGVIAVAAGAIVIAWPGPSASVVAVVFGIWLMLAGLFEVVGSLRLKRLGAHAAVAP